jgi:hypothetical protein
VRGRWYVKGVESMILLHDILHFDLYARYHLSRFVGTTSLSHSLLQHAVFCFLEGFETGGGEVDHSK